MIKTVNPATEEILNEYEMISKEQVNETVRQEKRISRIEKRY